MSDQPRWPMVNDSGRIRVSFPVSKWTTTIETSWNAAPSTMRATRIALSRRGSFEPHTCPTRIVRPWATTMPARPCGGRMS